MKRILSILVILTLCLSVISIFAYADEIDYSTKEAFEKLQEDGIVGYDISYEEWLEILERNKKLEKEFEENENFILVYEGKAEAVIPNLLPGDIIITNSTSSSGITGHAGIVIRDNTILHIEGPGKHPDAPTIEEFKANYNKGWIMVYRTQYAPWGVEAAKWAERTYENSNAVYKITSDINSTNETYCSKIVFQAYKFGPGKVTFRDKLCYKTKRLYVAPYDLKDVLDIRYAGNLDK
jgi:hypothetical protein